MLEASSLVTLVNDVASELQRAHQATAIDRDRIAAIVATLASDRLNPRNGTFLDTRAMMIETVSQYLEPTNVPQSERDLQTNRTTP